MVTRRDVMKGAAWAAPAIVLSVPAPAFALSPIACPTMPSGTQWTPAAVSGTLGTVASGGYGWDILGTNFNVYRDNGSTTATLTFTTQVSIPVVSGRQYNLSSLIQWGYGNGTSGASTGLSMVVTMGGTQIYNAATRSATGLGAAPNTTTRPFTTYTATTTGT